ncbi:MAG: hypothetical protein IT232_06250 [Flavobacteriales bacterium]|nr:hypothetical protein [Flavobacteriales bacterium]
MTDETKLTLEILKLCTSLLTPILVLMAGLLISRKLEKNKLEVLKEKEWQVKWAELFFKQATDFNDSITNIITLLFLLQTEKDKQVSDEMLKKIKASMNRISEIDWNIRNYAQFSKNHQDEVVKTQQELMNSIRQLIDEQKGDLEKVRKQQFEYNDAVRKAHSEILKMK